MEWRKVIRSGGIVALAVIIYSMIAYISLDRPSIDSLVLDISSEGQAYIDLHGDNLKDIICVYLNHVWGKECQIQYISDEEIILFLPERYVRDMATLTIQLEKKINSDKNVFSNKVRIENLEEFLIKKPTIISIEQLDLGIDSIDNRRLKVVGENFTGESAVLIDDMEYNTIYIDESNLEIEVPFSAWDEKETVAVEVLNQSASQNYTKRVKSNEWMVAVSDHDNKMDEKPEDSLVIDSNAETGQMAEIFKQIDVIENYIEAVSNCAGMMIILSVKNDAVFGVSEQIQSLLSESGATETLVDRYRSGYILMINSGEKIYEEKSKVVEYTTQFGKSIFKVVSGVDESSIIIDDVEYSPNKSGLNIVVYSVEDQSVYDIVNCDVYDGNIFTRYELADINEQFMEANLDFMLQYMDNLINDNYLIFLSAKDDAGSEWFKDKLEKVGLNKEIEYRKSYIGIVNGLQCVYEETGDGWLAYDEDIEGVHIHVESAGYEAGSFSSIMIDGVEYSNNTRGLNIVIFDKTQNEVIDIITFDVFDRYSRDYYLVR